MFIMENNRCRFLLLSVMMLQSLAQPRAEMYRHLAKNDDDFAYEWRSSCLLFLSTRHGWTSAQTHCQNLGGSLVEVNDTATHRHIETILKFNKKMHTGTWWIGQGIAPTRHVSGNNSGDSLGKCYLLDLNITELRRDNCVTEHRSVCSIRPSENQRCIRSNGKSYRYAEEFNGFCYIFVEKELTWFKAEKDCKLIGGQLTDVLDQKTTDFINIYRQKHNLDVHDAWIGLFWVKSESRFIWPKGKLLNYTNWEKGEPSTLGMSVVVSAQTGRWRNVSPKLWTKKMKQYICKAELSSSTSMTSQMFSSTNLVTENIPERRTKDSFETTEILSLTTSVSPIEETVPGDNKPPPTSVPPIEETVPGDNKPPPTSVPPIEETVPGDNKPPLPVAVVTGIVAAVVVIGGVVIIILIIVIKKRRGPNANDNTNKRAVENTIYYSVPLDCIRLRESRHNSPGQESDTAHNLQSGNCQPSAAQQLDTINCSGSCDEVSNHLDAKSHGLGIGSNSKTYLTAYAVGHVAFDSEVETYNHLDIKSTDHVGTNTNIYDHAIAESKGQRYGGSCAPSAGYNHCRESEYDHMDVGHNNRMVPEEDTYDHAELGNKGDDVYANSTSGNNLVSQETDIYEESV